MLITYTRGYKYRIADIPANEPGKQHIRRNGGCSRKVYNLYVDSLFGMLESCGYTGGELPPLKLPEVTEFKEREGLDFLKDADSLALSNTKLDFEAAVKRFSDQKGQGTYRGGAVRRAEKGDGELTFRDLKGMPRFHSKKENRYSYTTNNQHPSGGRDTVRLDGSRLHVPKLKEDIILVLHRKLPSDASIKNVTLSMEPDGSYYASIQVAYTRETDTSIRGYGLSNDQDAIKKLTSVGLDYDQADFYVDNGGRKPNCPHAYKKSQEKLARLQRKLSRMEEGSGHYKETLDKVRRLHVKTAAQRKDFCHKESRYLATRYDFASVEDIDLRAMGGSLHLGKNLHDNGFGMFRTFLDYKLQEKGSLLIRTPRMFASSKTCSCCGYVNHGLTLGQDSWVCPNCGAEHDRDQNAGENIHAKGYEVFAEYVAAWQAEQDAAKKRASALHDGRVNKSPSKKRKGAA